MIQNNFQVKGKFQEDSVKIGEKIHYSLWVKHSGKNELFFPGTQQNFGAFEVSQKDFFKTREIGKGQYLDSAVYELRLFQSQNPKILQIPVYLSSDIDCTAVYPKSDTIFVKTLVKSPETIQIDSLFQSIPFQPISPKRDIKTVLFDLLILLVIIGIINTVLGKRIKLWIQLYFHWRKFRDFQKSFQRLNRNVNKTPLGIQNLEKALVLWKKYLEQITGLGFATSTSKEIIDLMPENRLEKALNELDFTIYGGNFSENTSKHLEILLKIAQSKYNRVRQNMYLKFKKS